MSEHRTRVIGAACLIVSVCLVLAHESSAAEQRDLGTAELVNLELLDLRDGVYINGKFFPYRFDSWRIEGVTYGSRLPVSRRPRGVSQPESRLWRAVGAFAGGGVGFVTYFPYSISENRRASDTRRLTELSLVTAGAAYLGYLIGKRIDER